MGVYTFWILMGSIFFILTMTAVLDVAGKDFGSIKIKALWGCIAVFPVIGWLIYLIFGYRKGKRPV